jgi:hypothetical protein
MRPQEFNGLNLMVSLSNHGSHRFSAALLDVRYGDRLLEKRMAVLRFRSDKADDDPPRAEKRCPGK